MIFDALTLSGTVIAIIMVGVVVLQLFTRVKSESNSHHAD